MKQNWFYNQNHRLFGSPYLESKYIFYVHWNTSQNWFLLANSKQELESKWTLLGQCTAGIRIKSIPLILKQSGIDSSPLESSKGLLSSFKIVSVLLFSQALMRADGK